MARFSFPLGILLLVFTVGCNQSNYFHKASQETETSAEVYFDLLRQHLYEQLENVLDPSLKDPNLRSTLTNMAALIPDQNPESTKLVWSKVSCSALTCDTNLLLEYRYPNERLVVNEVIREKGSDSSVMRFQIRTVSEAQMEANRFTIRGKGVSQYTALALAISLPLLSLYALVLCISTKGMKRKWLWAAFILIGLGRVGVVWTNGLWSFNIFYVQLLSAGFFAQLYGPVAIYLSVPLGAIVFLRYRRKLSNPAPTVTLSGGPPRPTADMFTLGADKT